MAKCLMLIICTLTTNQFIIMLKIIYKNVYTVFDAKSHAPKTTVQFMKLKCMNDF